MTDKQAGELATMDEAWVLYDLDRNFTGEFCLADIHDRCPAKSWNGQTRHHVPCTCECHRMGVITTGRPKMKVLS
jgi:hypothetical protein